MQQNQFPPGWDEKKIRELIDYHERQMNSHWAEQTDTMNNNAGVEPGYDLVNEDWEQSQKQHLSLSELVADIHLLQEELETFEQLYGILSTTFYEAYLKGEEPENAEWTLDWAEWAATYQVWLRRQAEYRYALQSLRLQAPSLTEVIQQSAERASALLPVGA